MLRVVVVEPGCAPEVRYVPGSLTVLQGLVGGWLQCVPVHLDGALGAGRVVIYCCEDGIRLRMPRNRAVHPGGAPILGTYVAVAVGVGAEHVDMSAEQVDAALRAWAAW